MINKVYLLILNRNNGEWYIEGIFSNEKKAEAEKKKLTKIYPYCTLSIEERELIN